MLFTKWLSDVTDRVLRKRTRKLARKVRQVSQRAMSVSSELLESRVVPTIDVTLAANGVLTIAGDTSANELTISVSGNVYTLESTSDTFNVLADSSSTADGNGTDTLTIGTAVLHVNRVDVDLGEDDDTLILDSTGDVIFVTDTGVTENDILQGQDVTTAWKQNSLTVSGKAVTFSGIDVLQGGSSNDTFTIDSTATLDIFGGDGNDTFNITAEVSGTLDGGDGDDTFVIDEELTAAEINGGDDTDGAADSDTLRGKTIDGATLTGPGGTHGFTGLETSISGGFDNINVLIGTNLSNSSTLTGEDTGAPTWTLSGATSTYENGANSLSFNSGFGILQGGIEVDTFNVTSNTKALVAGGAGNDVFDVNATLTGQLSGEDGDDQFVINATVTGDIDGGADNDTLEGTQINGVTLTGTDGSDGFDGNETSITGGFDHINAITGNGGTLKGLDEETGSTWDLVDDVFPGTYTALDISLSFGGFSTLQGGSETDNFNINTTESFNLKGGLGADIFTLNAHLTGSINGEGDTDLLEGEAIDNVTLTSSVANGLSGNENSLTGGFSGIDALNGNGGTLTGIGAASTWTVSSNPQYKTATATLDIVGFTTLQGGSAADTFYVNEDVPFDLNGGMGNDKIVFNNATLTGGSTANGGGGNDTLDGQLSTGPVSLVGGDGNDILIGSEFSDTLDGGIGNDRLFGLGSDDTMMGGAGNDSLVGGADNDRLVETVNGNATITNTKMTGGNGTDTLSQMEEIEITGNDGNNALDASTYTLGAVALYGGEGNDTLSGGALFGDLLDGGAGDDVVKSNVAGTVTLSDDELVSSDLTDVLIDIQAVSLTGSAGDDNIDASSFSLGGVSISGGAGNDTITGGSGADFLNGNAGNDDIGGGAGSDTLLGGAGNDILDGGDDNDRINGNDGNDLIEDTGTTDATFANGVDDSIFGEGGNDSINAGIGDDFVDAGAGNDTVFGEDGADNIAGGAGLDSIEGGAGADFLNGNADADRIEGGEDNDQIFGGAGNDVLLGEAGDDRINSQSGNDTMLGGSGGDTLLGGTGNELMFGDSPDEIDAEEEGGNDSINGGAGNDTLIGGDGDDSILGGAGNDLCLGGVGGNDTINGQAGTDTVYGGGDLDSLADPSKEAPVKISNAFILPASVEGYEQYDANGQRYLSSHDYYFSLFDSTKFLDLDAI